MLRGLVFVNEDNFGRTTSAAVGVFEASVAIKIPIDTGAVFVSQLWSGVSQVRSLITIH